MEIRERMSQFEARVPRAASLPFGLKWTEIIAAALAIVFLAFSITRYWTTVRPEQDRLRTLEEQLANQQREIVQAPPAGETAASPSDIAKEALASLEQFKSSQLRPIRAGEIDLFKELNALAKKNGVVLTSGIDTTLRPVGYVEEDTTTAKKSARQKRPEDVLNAFPALAVRFSVGGEYASLRGFINDLESSKQFLVVTSVGIASQEGRTTGRSSRANQTSGLLLSVELNAYFRPD